MKVTIVGQGIAGLTLAQEALDKGFSVTLISADDKKPASSAAVGISTMKGLQIARDPFFRRKLLGHQEFQHTLTTLQSIQGPQIWQKGVWEFFRSSQDCSDVAERIYHNKWRAHERVSLKNSDDLYCYSQGLMCGQKSFGGFFYPDDYFFSPQRVLDGMFKQLCCHPHFSSVKSHVLEVQANQVRLPNGWIQVSNLVLCTGAETPVLLAKSGIICNKKWKLTPGTTFVAPRFGRYMGVKWGTKGLVSLGKEFRFGSDDSEQPSVDQWCQMLLRDYGININESSVKLESGIRLRSQGRKPVAESVQDSNQKTLWVMAGFHRNGYSLAKDVAHEILGKIVDNPNKSI